MLEETPANIESKGYIWYLTEVYLADSPRYNASRNSFYQTLELNQKVDASFAA